MTLLKRSVMMLYSDPVDVQSHKVRFVLAEKGVSVDVVNIEDDTLCEELAEVNPYNSLPTLVDRELVLYSTDVILEYLDERFPHPPLLPVYPVARAKSRLMMYRIDRDWYPLIDDITQGDKDVAKDARNELLDSIITLAPVFADKPFFLSEEFSLVDCCVGVLLWRLPMLGIELPKKKAKPVIEYCKRLFDRSTFQASLTEAEQEIGEEV